MQNYIINISLPSDYMGKLHNGKYHVIPECDILPHSLNECPCGYISEVKGGIERVVHKPYDLRHYIAIIKLETFNRGIELRKTYIKNLDKLILEELISESDKDEMLLNFDLEIQKIHNAN